MSKELPDWAIDQLTPSQSKEVEAKIADVELGTLGEVVVVISRTSSTIGHVPYSIFVSLLFLFTLIDLPHIQASFTGELWWPLILWPLLALVLTRILSSRPSVQRLFTPKDDRLAQVESRAEVQFYRQGLRRTDNSTGVLIYVSLLEHQAVILGDKSISQKIPPETWHTVLSDLTREAKAGNLASGLIKALDDISPILKQHFPATGKNPNELPNHLIFVDS